MENFFIVLLVLLLLVTLARRNNFFLSPGKIGELRVSRIISRLPDEYNVFNDVYLMVNGHSSQIDHVIISPYGIFVIETKNYSGTIYGSENAENWTQYLNRNRYAFRNPIKQNKSHVWAVKNTLHISTTSIIPIVVFLNKANLCCNTQSTVIYAGQLRDYILNHKDTVFTNDEVEWLSKKFSECIISDSNRKQNHIQSVKQSITRRELKMANLICPYCNGELVIREGKHGQFLGCSNYPQCKFTSHL